MNGVLGGPAGQEHGVGYLAVGTTVGATRGPSVFGVDEPGCLGYARG
jgi:hypothetical protein